MDDLERALVDAGAIALDVAQNKYARVPAQDALSLAVNQLHLDGAAKKHEEWLVSAPGKVILFGEHAVVHGVVSPASLSGSGTMVCLAICDIVNEPCRDRLHRSSYRSLWPKSAAGRA